MLPSELRLYLYERDDIELHVLSNESEKVDQLLHLVCVASPDEVQCPVEGEHIFIFQKDARSSCLLQYRKHLRERQEFINER